MSQACRSVARFSSVKIRARSSVTRSVVSSAATGAALYFLFDDATVWEWSASDDNWKKLKSALPSRAGRGERGRAIQRLLAGPGDALYVLADDGSLFEWMPDRSWSMVSKLPE